MIHLIEIGEENWLETARLSVREDQQKFLAPAIGILARGYAYRSSNARVLGIAKDSQLIGLALVRDMNEEPVCYELQQFMIDQRFQGQGYGTAALKLILAMLAQEGRFDDVEVCVHRDDADALHVYEKCGFVDTGYVDPGLPEYRNLMARIINE